MVYQADDQSLASLPLRLW